MDADLDQIAEDQINGGYGHILDQLAAQESLDETPLYPLCEDEGCEFCCPPDDEPLDGDHDNAMTSAGWGTDEDYGYFGDFGGDDF